MSPDDSKMPDPNNIRLWLASSHPKHLAVLDKFEVELKLGRLASSAAPDRLQLTTKTVELLKVLIGSTRWKNAAQLLTLLKGLGRELHAAGGFREPAIGNIVRRVMSAVREEAISSSQKSNRPSMQSILWANPQPSSQKQHQYHRSGSKADSYFDVEDLPEAFYQERPDLKQTVMEAISEIMLELEDTHKTINEQALSYIHAGEVILVYGNSKTVQLFLQAAATKKRSFQVVVCENAPNLGGHDLARTLAESGIDTIVINDSATFAVMARVNKVILAAHAVLANGGLISASGSNMVALAASHMSVPVVCVTGLFKLCPIYPHEGQDTLQDLTSPSSVVKYAELSDTVMKGVEFLNPLQDYIAPELITLYVTNAGSFQPSYIYRLLAENYHSDDWESFE